MQENCLPYNSEIKQNVLGGHFEVKEGHPDFFTNNMIFLECGVIALIEAFYMFRDHNHVKSFDMLNDFIPSCSAQVTISQEVAK